MWSLGLLYMALREIIASDRYARRILKDAHYQVVEQRLDRGRGDNLLVAVCTRNGCDFRVNALCNKSRTTLQV